MAMTREKLLASLQRCAALFKQYDYPPEAIENAGRSPQLYSEVCAQAHWMCLEAQKFAEKQPARALMWLGFAQGVLYAHLPVSMDELTKTNGGDSYGA